MTGLGSTTNEATGVACFLYREARLLDEHDYDAWLELWHEEGVFLVPANGEPGNPERQVSLIYDNRGRLGRRVQQLQTGYRYAQLPQSRTQHFVTNVEVSDEEAGVIRARSAYMIMEARFGNVRTWAGRAEHELVPDAAGALRILRKTVVFIDNDQPVTTLGFLP
jgi:3-phenylpropionate/cinnamic acid dioxygenase small subunit